MPISTVRIYHFAFLIQVDGPTSHAESPRDLGLYRCRAATQRARPLRAGPSARFATAATPSRMSRGQPTSMMAPWSKAWSRRAALPGARIPTPYTSESKTVLRSRAALPPCSHTHPDGFGRYGVDMDFMGCMVPDSEGSKFWVNISDKRFSRCSCCVRVHFSSAELSWARTVDSATHFHTGARRCPNRVKRRDVDIVQAFLP